MPKVMLVEDDNNLREIYEARLQAEGYTIITARDGEEALVVAKSEKPDLVISDVMMPKISGFEMLDILRNTDDLKHVKVIMLTALGQADDQQRADRLGADRYLVKSQVTLEDIVQAAQQLLSDDGGSGVSDTTASTPATAATPSAAPVANTPVSPEPAQAAAASPATPPLPATQTTADETSSVEDQIKQFVDQAGAAPATDAAPQATPTPTADSAGAPVATDSSAQTNDQLINDSVNSLVADTEAAKPEISIEAPAVLPPAEDGNAATPGADGAQPEPATAQDSEPEVVSGHRKVIQPIDSGEPKKDLNQLLADEEAKENAAKAVQTPAPGSELPPAPESSAAAPSQTPPVDPNSIAL